MTKKKIYIAGKVTGLPETDVRTKFNGAAVLLQELGFQPVNPIEEVNDFNTPWDTAMKICISSMIGCDAVVLLPCWQESKGAKIERQLAEDLGILICNFNAFRLKVLKINLE